MMMTIIGFHIDELMDGWMDRRMGKNLPKVLVGAFIIHQSFYLFRDSVL
jgi:hypothetical protein